MDMWEENQDRTLPGKMKKKKDRGKIDNIKYWISCEMRL